ncbi:MAG: multicopper oxidase domain-containing protein [Kineosporiaceae bacterium]
MTTTVDAPTQLNPGAVSASDLYAQAFTDELRYPDVLRLGAAGRTLRLERREISLHSCLPPTPIWAYVADRGGVELINPTLQAERDRPTSVTYWNNLVGQSLPIRATRTAYVDPAADGGIVIANLPGAIYDQNDYTTTEGVLAGAELIATADIPPVAVPHLHGGFTEARSDGWTENLIQAGERSTFGYGNAQASGMFWYHDHAVHVTRLNVYAGLAGLYLVRDDDDRRVVNGLRLHSSTYHRTTAVRPDRELPLLIQDCNLDVNPDDSLTGQLVHKVDSGAGPMEFFGPFTMVNRQIWPKATVERRQYRLRMLNGANARVFRLTLIADAGTAGETVVPWSDIATLIGTDGGLRGVPLPPDADLVLAPAERLDVVVDFGAAALAGVSSLTVVNTAGAPYDGSAPPLPPTVAETTDTTSDAWQNRVRYPGVMRFDLTGDPATPRSIPALAGDFRRIVHDAGDADPGERVVVIPPSGLGGGHQHRLFALVEELLRPTDDAPTLTLRELHPWDGVSMVHDRLIELTEPDPAGGGGTVTTTYTTQAKLFQDASTVTAAIGDIEVWKVVNLSADTHPFHVHLVQMQVLGRLAAAAGYGPPDAEAWLDLAAGPLPFTLGPAGDATLADRAWKDVIRVDPGELVKIAVPFGTIDPVSDTLLPRAFAGRYMYHCHILEHEDHDMMRSFAVMPPVLARLMLAHHEH